MPNSPNRNFLQNFANGFILPFQGAKLILKHPSFWPLIVIPLVINLILFILFVFWGFHFFSDWLTNFSSGLEKTWYWKTLCGLIKVLYWLIVMVLIYFTFTPISLLIAAPFNDYLTERAEKFCGIAPVNETGFSVTRLICDIAFALVQETKRLLFCSSIFLLILCFNFLPLIGSVTAVVLGFYWACLCAGFEFISYCADRRHIPYRKRWEMLWSCKSTSLGFGLSVVLLLAIPFLNVFVLSIAASAGTILFGNLSLDPSEAMTKED